jgi:hypothetical protein
MNLKEKAPEYLDAWWEAEEEELKDVLKVVDPKKEYEIFKMFLIPNGSDDNYRVILKLKK